MLRSAQAAAAADAGGPAGVSVRAFEENPGLRDHWDVLSLSLDRQGEVYVSTFESRQVCSYTLL